MAASIDPAAWVPSAGIRLEQTADEVVRSNSCTSVIAGPGAGKTELLAQRAAFLLQTGGCRFPQRILAISFKRDAAKNLKERVTDRCGSELAERFDSYTFDAFAKSLLDRFLPLAPEWCRPRRDYRIVFPGRQDWNLFLNSLSPPRSLGGESAARGFSLDKIQAMGPLPREPREASTMKRWLAYQWWDYQLSDSRCGLTFTMIGRLAEAILRSGPDVRRALQLSYSHVFLDEFQDTTRFQFSLVKQMFEGSPAVLTAVGDTKQRIMTWAGAEAEVFDWFDEAFIGQRRYLQLNHRSNRRLVKIVNALTKVIEPDAVETLCGRSDAPVPQHSDALWEFRTNRAEADAIADLIAQETAQGALKKRRPEDFLILVRMKPEAAERALREAFEERGLHLRNEAKAIRKIPIQDLMADDLVGTLLGILGLAAGQRGHDLYRAVQDTFAVMLGTDFQNGRDTKILDREIENTLKTVQAGLCTEPGEADMEALVSTAIKQIGQRRIRRSFQNYRLNPAYLEDVGKALAELMKNYAATCKKWPELLDAVRGKGQVPLMTIHKSKGLERHTVIFLGFHDRALFGYRRNPSEETNTFFVALSRARERLYFTTSREEGDIRDIAALRDFLEAADVPIEKR